MKAGALHDPALQAALVGMAGLATAMGIGRFAFTPMLPLMQLHELVSLRQGSYLATANYVGYLLGALLLFAFNPPPAPGGQIWPCGRGRLDPDDGVHFVFFVLAGITSNRRGRECIRAGRGFWMGFSGPRCT